ncbi:MAG: glycosyltransferase family 1 protein [Prolixibacteraceae bacterium]|jgi:glycosyltransferase involved in cell wall biosynthesis|nr:glycosyltransferase family 1 protein [Prolixibacteraceae bacterium]
MKIAVNTQHLLKDKLEGIGWFAHETLRRITKQHPEHEFLFIFDRPWHESFIYSDNIKPVKTTIPSRHPFLWKWHYDVDIPAILKKHNPDVFFSPDGWMPLNTDVPVVDVIHDINFIHRPEDFPFLPRKYYRHYFPKFAAKAKRIVTVSEYSKDDISVNLNIEPEKIDVAHNGCSNVFLPASKDVQEEIRKKFTDGNPFFIYVGSRNPRKNIKGMLDAFDTFKENDKQNFKFVFVGDPMWGKSYLNDTIRKMKHKDDLVFTGRLSTDALQMVLGSAEALVLASFSEGFGIPIIEAMHCDVPVICSETASLPEVAGDAALFVNPTSTDSIVKAFNTIANKPETKARLIEKGQKQREKFNWDYTAEKVWNSILSATK